MTENIEGTTRRRKHGTHFWDQLWDATSQIEELNRDNGADPYARLFTVRSILEDLECAATFAKGRGVNETTFLIVAIAEAISNVTWDHFMDRQAAE